MLETLRAYGTGLLTEAGELEEAAVALAGYALRVAEQAAAGLETTTAEVAAPQDADLGRSLHLPGDSPCSKATRRT